MKRQASGTDALQKSDRAFHLSPRNRANVWDIPADACERLYDGNDNNHQEHEMNQRRDNCPEKYSLSLYMKRPYFFNKEISQHDLRIGSRITLPWKYLRDDMEYYLRIEFDPPRTDGAGQGAGAEPEPPGPDCCLEVDVVVIPFSAPRKRPGMDLA